MCWLCDNSGATPSDYKNHVQNLIASYGWAVQGVERDGNHPPWAYTVGLSARELPELVVTGTDLAPGAELLNRAAILSRDNPGLLVPGTHARISGTAIQLIEVTRPWAHLNMAVVLYGEGIRALQLVCADDAGHWPWEAAYAGQQGGQPVLGRQKNGRRTA